MPGTAVCVTFLSMTALLLTNARVRTMTGGQPVADAVAVRDGRILAVGTEADAAAAPEADAQPFARYDCGGGLLLPAFIDAHCHLLSFAAALRSVDCTAARSIADIQAAIRERAEQTPAGSWLRAAGYEETQLAERRHPNCHELDAAAPRRPVRLIHRGGHASVLNSAALRLAGIDIASEAPPGGFIDREVATGEPSGLLLGMDTQIGRAVPPLAYDELAAAVRDACRFYLQAGVTCIQDATHTNGLSEWRLFERLMADGALSLGVVLMEGIENLGELPEDAAGGQLRRGPVKIMLQEHGDDIAPDEGELTRAVREVHGAGRQAAIHAVGERAVIAAAAAIEAALALRPRPGHRHRIEHCGLLPEGMAPRLAELGVYVVSQPSFVAERGERFLQLVAEARHDSLYAFRTLEEAGVRLAAGSDAPVTRPDPLKSIAAAVERRTAAGRPIGPRQAVDVDSALRWWTAGAAEAAFLEPGRGSIQPGARADLVLLTAGTGATAGGSDLPTDVAAVWKAGEAVEAAGGAGLLA